MMNRLHDSTWTSRSRAAACNRSQISKTALVILALLWMITAPGAPAGAQDSQARTAGGLTVYLGVVPAAFVKGPSLHSAERPMHGGAPRGRHEYHFVAAIFDASTNARISDATVTAQVSGLGLSGPKSTLEPMEIASTITYGAFFNLPGADLYSIRLTIQRPGSQRPVVVDFKYDHRRLSAREVANPSGQRARSVAI
jgi:hypothetical protein